MVTTPVSQNSPVPSNTVRYNVNLRAPHPKQVLFLRSRAKRKIIKAGRRGGKTTGVGILACESFLGRDNSITDQIVFNFSLGKRVLYAAPTNDQVNKFWAECKIAFAEPIAAGALYKNETEHIIGYADPSQQARIRAKTAWNADTLRGDYADLLILDEWQLMNESAWEEVGAPMLIDNNGDAVFIYTPPSLHYKVVSKARDLRHASKMFKKAQADKTGRWQVFHFTSHDNPHVSEEGIREITIDMTALAYRQEIMAEDIDEIPGALWTRALIENTRVEPQLDYSQYARIVVGIDPSGSSTNEAGIVAAGELSNGHIHIIADRSLLAPTPRAWASAAVQLYYELKADRIVGERNFGGDMVESTIRTVDDNVSYKDVQASRGKMVRAEPVAALYEKGIAHNAGKFERLEEEQCSYVPGNPSPNRMDAMVWAVTELKSGGQLGLVEYFKQGMAESQLKAYDAPVNVAEKIQQMDLGKVVVNDKTSRCPECDSHLVQRLPSDNNMMRCAQCGVQWSAASTSQSGNNPFASRTEYLSKLGRRNL